MLGLREPRLRGNRWMHFLVASLLSSGPACVLRAPDGSADPSTRDAGAVAQRQLDRACAPSPPSRAARDLPSDGASAALGAARAPLAVMTWNLEWFQDPSEGPADDATQYAAVRDILAISGMGLIALQEVASEDAFERLTHDLPRYAGLLSGYAWT